MDKFWWVILLISVFIGGQWMMMRPSPREKHLMLLREAARKLGLQPKLIPPPEWLVLEHKQFIACYSLIIPTAKFAYSRCQQQQGQWRCMTGTDLLAKTALIPQASYLLAIEAQANSISFYWQEEAGMDVLEPIKAWLTTLAEPTRV
ncbi:hypothetical protein [Agitococcus lubricus]|uniref:Uncharacterized protein n=1 Tax=Agitococcus lubricus TaxID=1077255 RepID=A0A2T5J260_9GAMM|nr:hypothetical protein [Agitococcus lubricus]PTQ90433.1 hypothetical protein C8N29_103186 [Agitococcus lubricus]